MNAIYFICGAWVGVMVGIFTLLFFQGAFYKEYHADTRFDK